MEFDDAVGGLGRTRVGQANAVVGVDVDVCVSGLDVFDLDPFILAAEFPATQEKRAVVSHADCPLDAVSWTRIRLSDTVGDRIGRGCERNVYTGTTHT